MTIYTDMKKEGDKDPCKRVFAKLLANAMYGCMLKKSYKDVQEVCRTQADFDRLLSNPDFRWTNTFRNHEGLYVIKGEIESYSNEWLRKQIIFIGAAVIAYWRLMLDRAIKVVLTHK